MFMRSQEVYVSSADKIRTGLFAALCLIAQIVPAWMARGGSPYLIDQADQIQSGQLLLQGDWRHLYGPYMSDTVPLVRTIGPAGTLMFALPSYFGGFPAVEIAFILLMALAPLLFYFEFRTTNPRLAAVWTAILVFVPHHWYFLTVAWEPLLLLPACLFVLTSFLRFLRRRCLGSLLLVMGTSALALHIHLIAVLLAPFAAAALVLFSIERTDPHVSHRERRQTLIAGIALLAATVLPYLIAELIYGSRNYKAVRANLGRWNDWQTGWQTALTVLERLTTIYSAPGFLRGNPSAHPAPFWLSWPALFAATGWVFARPLFLIFRRIQRRGHGDTGQSNTELILWLVFALVHAGALAYFTKMSRPYLGDHYAAFLVPLTVFPMSTLAASLWGTAKWFAAGRRWFFAPNVIPWLVLVLWMGYSLSRFPASRGRSDWNFRNITDVLGTACDNADHSLTSFELEGFYSPLPGIRPLLRYTVETYVSGCRWDEHAAWLLHPKLSGTPPDRLQIDVAFPGNPTGRFRLIRTFPPGIGLYKREPDAGQAR